MKQEVFGTIREFREVIKRWRKSDGDAISSTAVVSYLDKIEKELRMKSAKSDEGNYCSVSGCVHRSKSKRCTHRCIVAKERDFAELEGRFNTLDFNLKQEIDSLLAKATSNKTGDAERKELVDQAERLVLIIERAYGHENMYIRGISAKIADIRLRGGNDEKKPAKKKFEGNAKDAPLADLADRLSRDARIVCGSVGGCGEVGMRIAKDVETAHLIVAEVAKIESPVKMSGKKAVHLRDVLEADKDRAVEIVRNCREIVRNCREIASKGLGE